MGPNKRKLGPKPKQESADAKEREQDTIREINKVLDQKEVRPMFQPSHDKTMAGRINSEIAVTMQVDLAQLRKLAAARGLVNNEVPAASDVTVKFPALHCRPSAMNLPALCLSLPVQIRARVWPLLLGVQKSIDVYDGHKAGKHRDSSVVDVDVQRSLWAWTEGWWPIAA